MKATLARTVDGIRQNALLQLSAIGAITATAVIVGLAAIAALNATRLTAHWGAGIHLVVQLQHDVDSTRLERMRAILAARPEVSSVRLISPRVALQRLRKGLGARSGLLEDMESDVFPASFELRLKSEHRSARSSLVSLIQSLPEVERIDHLGRWAERLDTVASLLRAGLLLLALLVALAGLYIVASATRIGMFSRAEEIGIQRLLGATDRFVNTPLMLEGLIQGCVSVALALGLLYAAFSFVAPRIDDALSPILGGTQLAFLTPAQIGLVLLIGSGVGLLGSRLAIGQSARG